VGNAVVAAGTGVGVTAGVRRWITGVPSGYPCPGTQNSVLGRYWGLVCGFCRDGSSVESDHAGDEAESRDEENCTVVDRIPVERGQESSIVDPSDERVWGNGTATATAAG
jgi:hypothetical protein